MTPPVSISYSESTSGSRGTVIRGWRNDPNAQHAVPTSIASDQNVRWAASPPLPCAPGATSTAMPTIPIATPIHVTSGGRSPVTARRMTTHSGMIATMSAATPLGT